MKPAYVDYQKPVDDKIPDQLMGELFQHVPLLLCSPHADTQSETVNRHT